MADRYHDRPFPGDDDYDRGGEQPASAPGESDPLAELARLIGQTDPFGSMGRANQQVQPRTSARDPYQQPAPADVPAAGPPPWMQRAIRQEAPQPDYPQDYPSAVHPLQRYATPAAEPEADYQQASPFDDADREPDPSRYDDALYGQLDHGAQQSQHDPAYADDPYAYPDGYGEGAEQVRKRRGGMFTIAAVLALAVVGTGAAFAYRTYVGSPRSGEPPIIKADTGPTKIVPAPSDGSGKVPDRMAAGDGTEKIVPREEAPVDVNAKSGPRVVFPPLNPNTNPPSAASVAPAGPALVSAGNGTLPNNEPRKIKTLTVRGDQPDEAATPVTSSAPPPPAKPAPAVRTTTTPSPTVPRSPPSSANASANAPLSLAPQGAQPAPAAESRARVAANAPAQIAPNAAAGGGGYLVQVSSQRNEADAQASYRALQGKFPAVLGSHAPLIKRADLGDKGIYYRAMVGPFGSSDEASQFCGSLKSAGGQCVVQRN
jgi:SPOR domain